MLWFEITKRISNKEKKTNLPWSGYQQWYLYSHKLQLHVI